MDLRQELPATGGAIVQVDHPIPFEHFPGSRTVADVMIYPVAVIVGSFGLPSWLSVSLL
jgi:uncharacterized membrane protein